MWCHRRVLRKQVSLHNNANLLVMLIRDKVNVIGKWLGRNGRSQGRDDRDWQRNREIRDVFCRNNLPDLLMDLRWDWKNREIKGKGCHLIFWLDPLAGQRGHLCQELTGRKGSWGCSWRIKTKTAPLHNSVWTQTITWALSKPQKWPNYKIDQTATTLANMSDGCSFTNCSFSLF